MDNFLELNNKLKELVHDDSIYPLTEEFEMSGLKYLQLRDAILTIGDVLEEDENNKVYVASIKIGLWKLGRAYIAVLLNGGKIFISAYAKKSLMNQCAAEKAIQELIKLLKISLTERKSKKIPVSNTTKKPKCVLVLWIFITILIIISVGTIIVVPFAKSTGKYNTSVQKYNEMVAEYNKKCELAFLDNLQGFDDKAPELPTIKTDVISLLKSLLGGNTTSKINSDIKTLNELTTSLKNTTAILKNIVNPDASLVINRLKNIEEIKEIDCVTEYNDPNQMLGKESGYTGCVYFSLTDIDEQSVKGKNVIERGTDGGGAIEIYANKDDALARCDYLEQFKDTILYSGSYVAMGTLVIRISYLLDDQQQYDYTAKIVDVLISIQD